MKKFSRLCAVFLSMLMALPSGVTLALASTSDDEIIEIVAGDLETIAVSKMTRIAVANPDVADISDAKTDKVLILGKTPGQTAVFIWDAEGKRSVSINVVSQDMTKLKNRLQEILEKADIKETSIDNSSSEGKLIITGSLSKEDKENLDKLLEPYDESVLNLTKEENSKELIQLDLQIIEMSTSFEKNLGIDWGSLSTTVGTGGNDSDSSGNTNSIALGYNENMPTDLKGAKDWFKFGSLNRTTSMAATLNFAISHGKARLISKPRLVVMSGKEASFLVGGEIPITSTTNNSSGAGGGTTENVTFKPYGVNLTVTPTIRGGKIDVLMNVNISDINKGSGNNTTFITRTAQTNLFMDDRQTIVLAGLIKHNDGESLKEVPFISKVPVVGLFFRNRKTPVQDTDTETIIIFTPTIMRDKKLAKNQTVMPTPKTREFVSEIESKFEQEPVNSQTPTPTNWYAPQPTTVAPMNPYAWSIQQKISRAISYPYEALQNNWQGTVKLKLHILKDGTLAAAEITESSGHNVFDADALNTAKITAPYAVFSPDMKQDDLFVTIPIVYSQDKS